MRWLLTFALAVSAFAQVKLGGAVVVKGNTSVGTNTCGPPLYSCSRNDVTGAPVPSVPPQVGPNTCTAGSLNTCGNVTGSNTVVADPDFGNRMVRVTDNVFDSRYTNNGSTYLTAASGSGDENLFSLHSDMFIIGNSHGSQSYPVTLYGPTMATARLYPNCNSGANCLGGGMVVSSATVPGWGRASATNLVLFAVAPSTAVLQQYDFSAYPLPPASPPAAGAAPTATTFYDFTSSASCLPSGFTAQWASSGLNSVGDTAFAIGWSGTGGPDFQASHVYSFGQIILPLTGNAGGYMFQVSVAGTSGAAPTWPQTGSSSVTSGGVTFINSGNGGGGQGNGVFVTVYVPGSGCTMWNTMTGIVTSDFGSTGIISLADRFGLHNIKMNEVGDWVVVAGQSGTCTTTCNAPGNIYLFNVGTTTISTVSGNTGGHWTACNTHWVNNGQTPIGQWNSRLFTAPGSNSTLIGTFPSVPQALATTFDNHPSCRNSASASNDTNFLLGCDNSTSNNAGVAWHQECIGVPQTSPNKVVRFNHSFATRNSQIFDAQETISAASQDGKYIMFTSDWLDTLGNINGTASCTEGTNCRSDVWITELK